MTGSFFEWLSLVSYHPALLGSAILIHSTVVLSVGLLGHKIFKLRGMSAGARSLFLKSMFMHRHGYSFYRLFHFLFPFFSYPCYYPIPSKRTGSNIKNSRNI